MLRYFSLWASIGWLLVVAICYLSLMASPPGMDIDLKYSDKLGHFISYFFLMFWFAQLYKTPAFRIAYILFFSVMGAGLELMQGLGGVRFFEYSDMLANTTGVLFGWFITRGKLKNTLLALEQIMIESKS